ncbi:MAG TPA: hypothetical protein PK466_12300 [Thermotogota bacterium]|nr:hypothetical protein [Thermotogota bacterium]
MREEYLIKIDTFTEILDKDHAKFLYTDVLKRLINKLSEEQIGELKGEFDTLLNRMQTVSRTYDRANRKETITQLRKIKKIVHEKYGYREKGIVYGFYFILSVGLSIVYGSFFDKLGISMALGMLFGMAIATGMEKREENKGLIY